MREKRTLKAKRYDGRTVKGHMIRRHCSAGKYQANEPYADNLLVLNKKKSITKLMIVGSTAKVLCPLCTIRVTNAPSFEKKKRRIQLKRAA